MQRATAETLRFFCFVGLAVVLFFVWGTGMVIIKDSWDPLHVRFPWFPSSSTRLGFAVWLAYACALAVLLLIVFNIIRFFTRPREVRGKFTWVRLFFAGQKRLVISPDSTALPQGNLENLVGFLPLSESTANHFFWSWPASLLLSLVSACLWVYTVFMFGTLGWLIAVSIWAPSALLVYSAVILGVFKVLRYRYETYGNRFEAFVFGPGVSFGRSVQLSVGITIVNAIVFMCALTLFRGWTHRLPAAADPNYAVWQDYVERVLIPDFFRDAIAVVACILTLLEIARHLPMLRSLIGDYRTQKKLPRISWQNHAPNLESHRGFVLCHITDIHLTRPKERGQTSPRESQDKKTLSGEGPGIWDKFRSLLTRNQKALQAADAILITGDLTDTAHVSEWNGFFDAFEGLEYLFAKTVILPGNHDVNHCNLFRQDNDDWILRKSNLIRFLAAVDKVQGERTIVLAGSQAGACLFRSWALQFTSDFGRFLQSPPARQYKQHSTFYGDGNVVSWQEDITSPDVLKRLSLPHFAWREAFPMLVGMEGIYFLLLDSNMPGSNIVTNAFGAVNERQIVRAQRILQKLEELKVPTIVALHHHIGNPAGRGFQVKERTPDSGPTLSYPESPALLVKDRIFDRGLTLCNVENLLKIFRKDRSYIVFNGHRHMHYTGIVDGSITVVSGASTTLGNCKDTIDALEDRTPVIARYSLDWDESGSFRGLNRLESLR
jgi:3',5'-cyclic AMP phosphodiesterase CpdA